MGKEPTNPRVSIGIPIYRGEIYLEETLTCLLDQTFRDYEIILADNDPGGEVQGIAEAYASKYDFIRYIIHDKNLGALQNWNSIIPLARGEYFIYAGAHDLLSENAIEKMVDTLDRFPSTVLAYAPTQFMASDGTPLEKHIGLLDTTGSSLVQRFIQVMWGNQEALYGLMRMACVKRTRLQKMIVGSGAVWLSEMAIFGEFRVCNDILRYRRSNREVQNREEQLRRYHLTLFPKKRIRVLPHWRIPFHYGLACFRGKIHPIVRLRLFLSVLLTGHIKYGPEMIWDILSLFRRIPRGKLY
jgi:glycosyltransferase involved in cell wall biosynthesis